MERLKNPESMNGTKPSEKLPRQFSALQHLLTLSYPFIISK
jgi:hypothetical protein